MDDPYPLKGKTTRATRKMLTQVDKIWSKFFGTCAPVLSPSSDYVTRLEESDYVTRLEESDYVNNYVIDKTATPPSSLHPAKNLKPKIVNQTRKEILFEGMGNSLVISIRTTEKCLTNIGQEPERSGRRTAGTGATPSAPAPAPGSVHTDEVVKYLKWVRKNTHLPMNCFVVAFGYLYRLTHPREETGAGSTTSVRHPIVFTRSNWRLLVITAIMIAQKFSHDESYPNSEIVKLLGTKYTVKRLNKMEVSILTGLNWDCSFTLQEYKDYCRYLRWYATLL